jgi:sulfur carrier protein
VTDGPAARVELTVNGDPFEAPAGVTVADLVDAWCRSPRGVAVALDGAVVPRSEWGTTPVAPGATVELVTAAAGG